MYTLMFTSGVLSQKLLNFHSPETYLESLLRRNTRRQWSAPVVPQRQSTHATWLGGELSVLQSHKFAEYATVHIE